MRAFLVSVIVVLAVSLGAGYVMDGYFTTSAGEANTSSTTRL